VIKFALGDLRCTGKKAPRTSLIIKPRHEQQGLPRGSTILSNVSSYNAHNLFICIRFLLNLSYPALLRVFSGIINLPNFFFLSTSLPFGRGCGTFDCMLVVTLVAHTHICCPHAHLSTHALSARTHIHARTLSTSHNVHTLPVRTHKYSGHAHRSFPHASVPQTSLHWFPISQQFTGLPSHSQFVFLRQLLSSQIIAAFDLAIFL
jgi:hypothetical protein